MKIIYRSIYPMVSIYTDGSCIGNNGSGCSGGWAYVLVNEDNHVIRSNSGGESSTTNNRMELTAVIKALEENSNNLDIIFFTDSQLTMNCAQKLWKRKMNLDLWKIFDEQSNEKNIQWKWVKAHNGNHFNEMVDKLALGKAKHFSFS